MKKKFKIDFLDWREIPQSICIERHDVFTALERFKELFGTSAVVISVQTLSS